jgi:signal peptidase I
MPKKDLCKRVFCAIIGKTMEPKLPQNPATKASFWSSLAEWIKVIAIALLISLPIRFFIAEPFIVNGASMDPTFATGQFLIVDRLSYRFNEPKRGDVIVFRYPNNPSTYYIKRIIGLPGEKLRADNGKISIENKDNASSSPLVEAYIGDSHRSYDNFVTSLDDDQYFVMGDNRRESSDSRAWGPLQKDLIIGRPALRLYPITKLSIYPGEYNTQ